MLQNEIDEQKSHNEEVIERLNQKLVELQGDLEAKEHELRNLKFKSAIAETPVPIVIDVGRPSSKQDQDAR